MPYSDSQGEDSKRTDEDRRRYASSMISNYTEYSGPERRSMQDRRFANDGKVKIQEAMAAAV